MYKSPYILKPNNNTCSTEIAKLKEDLCRWGYASQILNAMNIEIKKMERSFISIKENSSIRGKESEYLYRACQECIANRIKDAANLMEFTERMDSIVSLLDHEEQMYIRLRYQQGMGFEEIQDKMYICRAKIFKLQNIAFEHLLAELEKE